MNTSYSDLLTSARLMVNGLKTTGKVLVKRGLDDAFLTRLQDAVQKAQDLDNEQEALKSQLEAKTAALNANRGELESLINEAKKLVKLDLPKTDWKQYGIKDSK